MASATTKQIRVGIAGQGRSGRDIHGRHLSQDRERYQIVAVADPLAERRQRAEQEYGCETHADYRDLLARGNDLDLIVNALPSHRHVSGSIEMLEAGFSVLCEKPLAAHAADVDRLIETAARANRLLTVFQQWRFSPGFNKLREIIASGVLGRIVQVNLRMSGFARRWDWQTLRENNGGALLNTGPHPLDMALRLLDTNAPPDVFCTMDTATSVGDAEDHVKVILRAENRPLIDIEISSCRAYADEKTFTVYGTQGGAQGGSDRLVWRYFVPAEAPQQHLIREPLSKDDGTPSYCRETLPWREETWEVPKAASDPAVAGYYAALYRTLTDGTPIEVTLPQIRQQIAVIEECHRQCGKAGVSDTG